MALMKMPTFAGGGESITKVKVGDVLPFACASVNWSFFSAFNEYPVVFCEFDVSDVSSVTIKYSANGAYNASYQFGYALDGTYTAMTNIAAAEKTETINLTGVKKLTFQAPSGSSNVAYRFCAGQAIFS